MTRLGFGCYTSGTSRYERANLIESLSAQLSAAREHLELMVRCQEVAGIRDGRSLERRLLDAGMDPITADQTVIQAQTFGVNWGSLVRSRKREVAHLQRRIAGLEGQAETRGGL